MTTLSKTVLTGSALSYTTGGGCKITTGRFRVPVLVPDDNASQVCKNLVKVTIWCNSIAFLQVLLPTSQARRSVPFPLPFAAHLLMLSKCLYPVRLGARFSAIKRQMPRVSRLYREAHCRHLSLSVGPFGCFSSWLGQVEYQTVRGTLNAQIVFPFASERYAGARG